MTAAKPATDRLVAEALAKSGLLWITSAAGSSPVWHVQLGGVAYVVSGPGEQFSPEHQGRVEVVARSKESRARLISFDAEADVISPDDEAWEAATFALKAGRLNAPAHDIVARWADECRVTRYTPDLATVLLRGELLDAPAVEAHEDPAGSTGATASASPEESASDAAPPRRSDKAAASTPTQAPVSAAASSAPEAELGTAAPGEPRPAAAAAERELRESERAESAGEPGADRLTP